MKQFIVGPVEMYPSTKKILEKGYTYFRTTDYGEMVKSNLSRLGNLMGVRNFHNMIYLACSGTGAMEAVVMNCTSEENKALVINGGTFGHRWCQLLDYHRIPFDSVDLDLGEALTAAHLFKYEEIEYQYMFVNLHETSTGQLYDIKMLSDFCKKKNMYLIVDAISTFLADDFDMEENGIDVTIISSQKGLCLSPGMSIVAFSDRMLAEVKALDNARSTYFDFKDYFINMERGQTPFTPTVSIMYELKDMLDKIEAFGGKKAWLAEIEHRCRHFRKRAVEIGLSVPDYPLSKMLTPLVFDKVNAREVVDILQRDYELFINPCGGDFASSICRVAHIGNLTIDDFDNLIEKIGIVVKKLESGK